MNYNRSALRTEAKKAYKEQVKGVPKKDRIPFSQFFKQYRKLKTGQVDENQATDEMMEDFNFENMVQRTEISDDSLEVEEDMEENNES